MNSPASTPRVEPVRKSITVRWRPEVAFRRFTEEIASWWPLRKHSVGGERSQDVVFESRPGGRIYEVIEGGEEAVWGTLIEYDAPHRVEFTWHPGREPSTAQRVEVRFSAAADGTRVDLVHSGWETFGEGAREMRDEYDRGWTFVLGRYAD